MVAPGSTSHGYNNIFAPSNIHDNIRAEAAACCRLSALFVSEVALGAVMHIDAVVHIAHEDHERREDSLQ